MQKLKNKGQSLVEYALIVGLIAIVAIAALNAMGGKVKDIFHDVNTQLNSAQTLIKTNQT